MPTSSTSGISARSKLAVFLLAVGLLGAAELVVLTWSDIAQISEARHTAYEAATSSTEPAAAKVALLFLIRTQLPTEPLWHLFLDSAAAAVHKATSGGSSSWEELFSVYVHPAPNHRLAGGSLFAGHEVPDRVDTVWGNHSMVDAERALLKAALQDPLNQRFVLLSESCMPVYSAPAVYVQLLSESRSRINACRNASDPDDYSKRMAWQWEEGMGSFNISRNIWRKSGQWFMLTRRHAEVVAADVVVDEAFRQHCCVAADWKVRFCVSDEHYVPTVLAWSGLEAEAACEGVITHTEWQARAAHPTIFSGATKVLLSQLRGGCNGSSLEAASMEAVGRLLQPARGSRQWQAGRRAAAGSLEAASSEEGSSAGDQGWLPPTCPLFARKIAATSIQQWAALLEPVMKGG